MLADAHISSLGYLWVQACLFVYLFVCFFLFLRAGEAKHRGIIGRGQSLRLREPHNASRDTHNKMEMHTLSPTKSRMKPGELGQNAPFFCL